jgi:hypothetical protein
MSPPPNLTPESLRLLLGRWGELWPKFLKESEEAWQSLERAEMLVAGNSVLPDGATDPLRAAHLNAALRRVRRALPIAEEYRALVEAIRREVPAVAAAAEDLGVDSSPLLLFAEEPAEHYLATARAVVARVIVRRAATTEKGKRSARQTGRPRKSESGKERFVLSALAKHHRYQPGGGVQNYEPAKIEELAKLASDRAVTISTATVSRFFKRKFPHHDRGYDGYVAACSRDARTTIDLLLALWQGEAAEHLAELLPKESGREDEDDD